MTEHHIPVLKNEVLEAFAQSKLKVFFDGTLGAGGHAEAILEAHPEIELYIACDRDLRALQLASDRLKKWEDKIQYLHGNFREVDAMVASLRVKAVDGFFLI